MKKNQKKYNFFNFIQILIIKNLKDFITEL